MSKFFTATGCLKCMRHPGTIKNKKSFFPYRMKDGSFSIALDRNAGKNYERISFEKLVEYVNLSEKYPNLRIRCKADGSGSEANGRFLREMMIDRDCLQAALIEEMQNLGLS